MKKSIFKSAVLLLSMFMLVFFFVSCSDKQETYVKQTEEYEPARKAVLLDYALFQDYKMTEEEVEDSLMRFLSATDGSKGLNSPTYSINKIDDSVVSLNGKCSSKALTSTEQDDITFSVYEVEDQAEEKKGFAITSNDKRIGEVLCYIKDGDFSTDISDNPGMMVFAVCLNDYIEETQEIWDEITDEDIQMLKDKYGITDDDIKAYKNFQTSVKGTTYGTWKLSRGNKNRTLLTTKWNQDPPYNEAITAVYRESYVAGCVATAVAQLMAYYEWPQKYTSSNLNTLKSKWFKAQDWDGVYDWKAMKSSLEQPYLGALMYEVAEGVHMKYGIKQSGTNPSNALSFLKQKGYVQQSSSSFFESAYYASDIASSIDRNRPVLIEAYSTRIPRTIQFLWWTITTGYEYFGHCWLIDGYYKMQRDVATDKRFLWWTWTTYSTETQTFVHCNYGWGGRKDGWYLSGVYAESLQYKIRSWCNIYPKK